MMKDRQLLLLHHSAFLPHHSASRFHHSAFRIHKFLRFFFFAFVLLLCLFCPDAWAQTVARPPRVAVLDFGETKTGREVADSLWQRLKADTTWMMLDRDEGRAAALGAGYAGSLNLTLEEARNLGAAIGCDLYLTGDAQTLRRSPSDRPVYYEAYASIFIVSAHTGKLWHWERPSFEASTPEQASAALLKSLSDFPARSRARIEAALLSEARERFTATAAARDEVIEEVPAESSREAEGLRVPQPYRRLRPAYTDEAARAEAEATVDVQVDIGADGEVGRVLVVRWAGFGLDESAVNTVRQLHFRPAMRDGVAVPMRVLLRYNFRRPAKEGKR